MPNNMQISHCNVDINSFMLPYFLIIEWPLASLQSEHQVNDQLLKSLLLQRTCIIA